MCKDSLRYLARQVSDVVPAACRNYTTLGSLLSRPRKAEIELRTIKISPATLV